MSLRVVAGWPNAEQFQESYGVVYTSRIIRVLLSGPACKQDPVKLQLIWCIADLLLQFLNMPSSDSICNSYDWACLPNRLYRAAA